jgi:hydrogenase expression/formation protein HypE
MSALDAVLESIASAARFAGVQVVAGDTKVVPRGAADGMFITTAGLGTLIEPRPAGPTALEVDDAILVTGPIGKHGVAVLAARENLGFEPPPQSDCGLLWDAAQSLREVGCSVRAMRDATRGGVAAVLREWAEASGKSIAVDEAALPVSGDVRGACELLGLDPLHLPNEGTMVVAVPQAWGDQAREALRRVGRCAEAEIIGGVRRRQSAAVVVCRGLGVELPLDEPQGASLPRIC